MDEKQNTPAQTFSEYLGDLSPEQTTELLTHLTNTNNSTNSIALAWQKALTVNLLQDEAGKFVGLLLTPDERARR